MGEINGDASLSATGNSVASLLGSSNGEVRALINRGSISKLLLEEMGLNIGSIVLTKLVGDKQVKLNCMAADFVVTKGLMRTRQFIVDTDDAVLHVDGTVNLANEQLDLTLQPDSKGLRVFSLRSPLYVQGTFSKPDVSVDKGVLALRAGGALALAVVAPVAALLPLVNTGPGEDSECASPAGPGAREAGGAKTGQDTRAKAAERDDDSAAVHLQLLHPYVRCRTDPALSQSYSVIVPETPTWRYEIPPAHYHAGATRSEFIGELSCKSLKKSPLPLPLPLCC